MFNQLRNALRKANPRTPEPQNFYNNQDEAEAYFWASKRWPIVLVEKKFVKLLLKNFGSSPSLKVLDVGTGPGWIPMSLAKAKPSWKITAVDYSGPMLSRASQTAKTLGIGIKWIQSLAEKIPIQDEQFDLIISHFAFSEFSNPEVILKEMKRLAKKGGHIIIQDMERPPLWLQPFLRLGGGIAHLFSARMRRQYWNSLRGCYTHREFKGLLEKMGLKFEVKSIWSNACGLLLRAWLVKERLPIEAVSNSSSGEIKTVANSL